MKKDTSITKTAVYTIIVQAVLIIAACLLTTLFFFGKTVVKIYDDMSTSIVGAALASVDENDMIALALQVDSVYKENIAAAGTYENNKEEWLSAFKDIQDSGLYREVWDQLNTLRQETKSSALDYVLIYPEDNIEIFILDACDANVLPCGELHRIDTSAYVDQPKQNFDGFITNSPVYGKLRTDGTGVYLDTEKEIYAYLLSDIPIINIASDVYAFLLQLAIIVIIIIALISVGVVYQIRKRVVAPLSEISEKAESFVENYELRSDNFDESHIFEGVDGGNITELRTLALTLQSMELEMDTYLHDLDRMTSERIRINTELDLARKIQAHILSSDFDLISGNRSFDIYATMTPAKEVGGDFYDFFLIDDDHLGLVIADVSGKGIPAALFMMVAKTLIQNRLQNGDSPSQALINANEQLCERPHADMFVTTWLCVIELSTGKAIDVNAGHEHPVLKRKDGEYEFVKYRHGIALGVIGGVVYNEHSFELHKGDTLFVYTDGLPEATSAEDIMFGPERMLEALNSFKDAAPQELLSQINKTVGVFVGAREPFDDLTMLALRF